MLLLHCSLRLHLRLCPSHHHLLLPASSSFHLPPARRLRRSTAVRAEPESPAAAAPPASEPEPLDASASTAGDGEGPVELRAPTLFSVGDNPTTLQTATSLLLTGAISVFLFRSLRRRARRAKELRVRSSGVNKPNNLTEEALEALRLVSSSPIEAEKPPSPVQALLGGIAAAVIAVILYKFTTTIEAALNRQTISDSFSVRQITITIRTIITGVCYLATSVFGINGAGLILYSLQLTFASIMGDDSSSSSTGKVGEQSSTAASSSSSTNNKESTGSELQQISDQSKNSTE
ncbi:hypothetical protein ACP4OV_012757 [Aristida adscensionis]